MEGKRKVRLGDFPSVSFGQRVRVVLLQRLNGHLIYDFVLLLQSGGVNGKPDGLNIVTCRGSVIKAKAMAAVASFFCVCELKLTVMRI